MHVWKVDSVTKIFNRNSDEFTEQMTLTVKLTVKGFGNGLSEKSVRIFSLRGCYAIAFFAKTEVAKQFRKWVLDLIGTEAQKFAGRSTTTDERTGLRDAVNAIVSKKAMLYPDAYKLVHQRFNVQHIDELTLEQVGEATEYLHRLLLNDNGELPQNWEPLIMCSLTCDAAWETLKPTYLQINADMTHEMDFFFSALSVVAKTAAKSIGFTPAGIHNHRWQIPWHHDGEDFETTGTFEDGFEPMDSVIDVDGGRKNITIFAWDLTLNYVLPFVGDKVTAINATDANIQVTP